MFSEITFFLIKDLNFQLLTVVWRNDKVRMPEPRPSIKTEALQVGNQNYTSVQLMYVDWAVRENLLHSLKHLPHLYWYNTNEVSRTLTAVVRECPQILSQLNNNPTRYNFTIPHMS